MNRFVLSAALLTAMAAPAFGQTFTNAGGVTINDAASASPYPSNTFVSGGPASIGTMSVTLNRLSHTYIGDIDILLVGPGGQSVVLMSDVGNGVNFAGETLIFTNQAGTPAMPNPPIGGGTFAPINVGGGDPFAAPAPAGPYGADFAAFAGTNANGTWSLYIVDDAGADIGSIASWSLTFGAQPPEPTSNYVTYQGKLTNGGVPVNGSVDVAFSLWRNSFSTDTANRVAALPTNFAVPVTDGLLTTQFNPGNNTFTNKELWLEIAVRNPAGGGAFVTLAGRQRITPAPSSTYSSESARLVATDGSVTINAANGIVGVNRPPTGIGAGTFIVEGTAGTGANLYGGMHVNTPDANAWPFVGLATANSFRAWMYYNPANTSMIFNNSGDQMLVKTNGVTVGTATLTAGNRMEVGGAIRATAFNIASSQRYKTNVKDLGPVLDRFSELRPVSYDFNQTVAPELQGKRSLGLIAEDVYTLFPDCVSLDEGGQPASIDYSRIAALSVQAIKELRAQNTARETELAELKARLAALEKTLSK